MPVAGHDAVPRAQRATGRVGHEGDSHATARLLVLDSPRRGEVGGLAGGDDPVPAGPELLAEAEAPHGAREPLVPRLGRVVDQAHEVDKGRSRIGEVDAVGEQYGSDLFLFPPPEGPFSKNRA